MSSTIAIVGVGRMGSSALSILLDERPDARFLAIDILPEAVEDAVSLAPDRVTGAVGSFIDEAIDLTGVDVLINFAGPFYRGAKATAAAAIAAGAAYVDIADDIEGVEAVLTLHDDAVRAGVPVIAGSGFSPGLSNWFASRLLAEHPDADGVQIAWAVHEDDPGGLAPLRHMLHLAVNPCPVWEDGAWRSSPGFVPSTAQTFSFPDPLGEVETYDTAHPEPLLLVRHHPELRYASCKGALLPRWANGAFSTLGRIGFADSSVTVRVQDTDIDPSEFLWRMLWARHDRKPAGERNPLTALLVQALRGDEVLGDLAVVDNEVMARSTGIGAAASALVLLDHEVEGGAWGPEVLPWEHALGHFQRIAQRLGACERGFEVLTPVR